MSPLRPKVRHANYDSPEALSRSTPPPQPVAAVLPPPTPKPVPIPTALARSVPNAQKPTRFERAIGIAKTVLPLVGKMLPLLEGNVVSAASNLLNRPMHSRWISGRSKSRSHAFRPSTVPSPSSLASKNAPSGRLEDDFAALQEAVQKNAADQAELIEHVAKLAKRTSSFMRLVMILLVVSILFTALLCIRIAYLIRFVAVTALPETAP